MKPPISSKVAPRACGAVTCSSVMPRWRGSRSARGAMLSVDSAAARWREPTSPSRWPTTFRSSWLAPGRNSADGSEMSCGWPQSCVKGRCNWPPLCTSWPLSCTATVAHTCAICSASIESAPVGATALKVTRYHTGPWLSGRVSDQSSGSATRRAGSPPGKLAPGPSAVSALSIGSRSARAGPQASTNAQASASASNSPARNPAGNRPGPGVRPGQWAAWVMTAGIVRATRHALRCDNAHLFRTCRPSAQARPP